MNKNEGPIYIGSFFYFRVNFYIINLVIIMKLYVDEDIYLREIDYFDTLGNSTKNTLLYLK